MQVKIWFQNRRSKVKKLVRQSPESCGDVIGAGDDVKCDQLSSGSADADPSADDLDDLDDRRGVLDNRHAASPSPASQQQQQQQPQLVHRTSSWDDVASSFQRFPALSQLRYSYPLSGGGDDSSTTCSWGRTDSYSSVHAPYRAAPSSSEMTVVAPRQTGYQSLLHGAAAHHWYSAQTPPPQTLLT